MQSVASDAQARVTDVLIIGAGWTGVSAAAELHAAGVDFELLEANPDHLGGRVYSFGYRPGPPGSQEYFFEHGAQYIGKMQTEIWALVQQYLPHALVDGYAARLPWRDQIMILQNKRYVYDRDDALFGIGGVPPDLDIWDLISSLLLIEVIENYERQINVVEPWSSPEDVTALDAITLEQWLDSQPWILPIAKDFIVISVQALLSVEPSEVSAFYFFWYMACNGGFLNEINDEENGPQQYYLATGIDRLIEMIAEPFLDRVHLGCPVQVIQQPTESTDEYTRVTLQDGRVWKAKKIIVALSPATQGRLQYDPPLPAPREQLTEQKMGRTIKTVVFYDEPWWRDSHTMRYTGYSGAVNYPVLWVMDYSPPGPENTSCHALMTFTVGAQADKFGAFPDAGEVTRVVTEGLSFLFNDERALATSPHFIDLVPYTWNPQQSFVGGGPNTVFTTGVLVGPDCPAKLLNEPWNDTVFFAASETARKLNPSTPAPTWVPGSSPLDPGTYSDWRQSLGYMDGAIVSGRYVAAQVLASLGETPTDFGGQDGAGVGAHDAAKARQTPKSDPPILSPEQTLEVLRLFSDTVYDQSKLDIPQWRDWDWAQNPEALQLWVTLALAKALYDGGVLKVAPIDFQSASFEEVVAFMNAFVQAAALFTASGNAYMNVKDASGVVRDIQELTPITNKLMQLKSAEPFQIKPGADAAARPSGRYNSFSRALSS